MSNCIHARKTENGELRFRVWSDNSESYISNEMSEKELREWILKEAVCETIERYNRVIDKRIQRACKQGTSSHMGETRDLNSLWDQERE